MNEFSVVQFNPEGYYEYVRRFVSAEEAVKAFKFYSNNVAASVGLTVRVIVTDGGDMTVAEWKFGEGVTYPPKEEKRQENAKIPEIQ